MPEATPAAALAFCKTIIESTHEVAAAYKPNAAFFEALGHEGVEVMHEVIKAIPMHIPVILDAKRGDISTTASAYADAAFNVACAGSVTVNAYMGYDSVKPFLDHEDKGIFVLCKTSNPTSNEFQTLKLKKGVALFEEVASLCEKWNKESNKVGVVVGATDADALSRTRAAAPSVWILAPGVGAQGGDATAAVAAGIRADGLGLLVPVSRGISNSPDRKLAAIKFRDMLNEARAATLAAKSIAPPLPVASGAAASGLKPYQREFITFAMKVKLMSTNTVCFSKFRQLFNVFQYNYICFFNSATFSSLENSSLKVDV